MPNSVDISQANLKANVRMDRESGVQTRPFYAPSNFYDYFLLQPSVRLMIPSLKSSRVHLLILISRIPWTWGFFHHLAATNVASPEPEVARKQIADI
jgi:hypothetical protein